MLKIFELKGLHTRRKRPTGVRGELGPPEHSPQRIAVEKLDLAVGAVAPGGKAIGLEMLPEILEVASGNAAESCITNIEWLWVEMEAIPLPNESVDVEVSNNGQSQKHCRPDQGCHASTSVREVMLLESTRLCFTPKLPLRHRGVGSTGCA